MVTTVINQKIRQIEDYLNSTYVEREEVVRGALCALLSGSDMVLLGPPGTAKSALTRSLCETLQGATYFEWLMTKFSTPEELFGPLSLKGLENDMYLRITNGKLPNAEIAFVDEVFKANSAILNTMLTLMNERLFHNNGTPKHVPLISMFGASNELPESDELNALYDRFMIRYQIGYITEDSAFEKMLKMNGASHCPVMTKDELVAAQNECDQIVVSDDIYGALISIRNMLKKEGIFPSDRRLRKTLPILKAHAWLRGSQKVEMSDIVFLQHVLWDNPNDLKTVKKVVKMTANPLLAEFTELCEAVEDVYTKSMDEIQKATDNTAKTTIGIESVGKIKTLSDKLKVIMKSASASGAPIEELNTMYARVDKLYSDLVKESLGITTTLK